MKTEREFCKYFTILQAIICFLVGQSPNIFLLFYAFLKFSYFELYNQNCRQLSSLFQFQHLTYKFFNLKKKYFPLLLGRFFFVITDNFYVNY